MQAVDVFTARDLRNRSGELLKGTEAGNMAVITKHGKPSVLAIPFDQKLLNHGAHRSMALQLFASGFYTLQQAAKFADMPLESFISLLGECGIDAVDYPADELESDLENALDNELILQAQTIGQHKTKKAVITEALKEYIQHRKQSDHYA